MTKFAGICLLFLGLITTALAQSGATGATQPPTTTINVNPAPTAPTGTTGAPPAAGAGSSAPSYGFWVTYGAMTAVLVIFIVVIVVSLKNWSLKDALMDDSANGGPKPSISRLIALLGFVVIISIYLGIGYSVIFRLLSGGAVGDLTGLGTFLVGAAALFTPYLANQIKSAAIGIANAQSAAPSSAASSAPTATVTSISPNVVHGGAPQVLTATGAGLTTVQSAVCTLENGSESPIAPANVNVLNAGAVQVNVTMPMPVTAGKAYSSTLTLVTNGGQRVIAGQFSVT